MKRLWKTMMPCMSDVQGFEAVVNSTDGLGIVDDPSKYKPIRGNRSSHGATHRSWDNMDIHIHGNRAGNYSGNRSGGVRTVCTEIRNADIVTGTEGKVLTAFCENAERLNPQFVLLCHAPSSSMIGSDLEAGARKISEISGIPAAYVNIDGSRDYLYGVSVTLEAIGKLLLKKAETRPHTVNILGCNNVDWTTEALTSVEDWLQKNGFTVLSHWGMKETAENLKCSAAAEVNLVVSEAGLRLAQYMKSEYNIPYIVGAPFGHANCAALQKELCGEGKPLQSPSDNVPSVLVVGEQFMANAIRSTLQEYGYRNIRVLSFFEMDKHCMNSGDAKLIGEDDLESQFEYDSVGLVICNPDCKSLMKRDVKWIPLPNTAWFSAFENIPCFDMSGEKLNQWLEKEWEA